MLKLVLMSQCEDMLALSSAVSCLSRCLPQHLLPTCVPSHIRIKHVAASKNTTIHAHLSADLASDAAAVIQSCCVLHHCVHCVYSDLSYERRELRCQRLKDLVRMLELPF